MLILIAVGLVLALGVVSGLRNTQTLVRNTATLTVQSLTELVRQHLLPARELTESLAALVAAGVLDPDDREQLAEIMTGAGGAAPQVDSIAYFDNDHHMVVVDRSGSVPRTQSGSWYPDQEIELALASMRHNIDSYWGSPIRPPGREQALINVRTPVLVNDEPRGLFVAAVTIGDLSTYLGQLVRSGRLGNAAFILSGPDQVVAFSRKQPLTSVGSEYEPLPKLTEFGDPVLSRLWDPDLSEPGANPGPGFEARFVNSDQGRYVAVFRRLDGFGPVPWIVGSYFAAEDVRAEFARLLQAAVAGLLVLVVAIVASIALGRRISRPVTRLADAATKLRELGPDQVPPLPRSHVRELDQASLAFNDMIQGLKEREMILSVFGRYVPRTVVEELLKDGGRPPAETRETTILFSDIEGYSTIAEKMAPETLVKLLNEYFELISEPIERHGGIITQYQGDAVVASFNLPVANPEHACGAIEAALEIQHRLEGRRFGDGYVLNTRIGLNTGVVVGGVVGSTGRLTYTIHGDAVNVAARIEELNKRWGTRLLVAESTRKRCGERFLFEHTGEIPIRGRQQPVHIYAVRPREPELKTMSADDPA